MLRRKPLPPYGKQYLEAHPDPGIIVAVGGDAWAFAARQPFPVMVLPAARQASDFEWPCNGNAALVHEIGQTDDDRLTELATALIDGGSPTVVAIRHGLLHAEDCLVFFERAADAA